MSPQDRHGLGAQQGNGRNVSAEVLDAIARALRASDAEHAHLTHMAKPAQHKKKRRPARVQRVRTGLLHLLDSLDGIPAYVSGARSDILAWNPMAAAVFGDWGAAARGAELGAAGVPLPRLPGPVRGVGLQGLGHGELSAAVRGLPPGRPPALRAGG
ncbi:hypothetical protein SMICM304S_01660 [Streptomyces microflavus]